MKNSALDYIGALSSEVRLQLTDLLAAIALANLGKRKDLRKLCGIAIELLDNAQRHCTSRDISFTWRVEGDQLVIRVENKAREADAIRLKEQVDIVRQMSPEQVTEEFRRQLTHNGFNERGGAGLGILQIAKKGASSFDVRLEKVADGGDYICTSTVQTSLINN